jgi:hydrogenase maturation protease
VHLVRHALPHPRGLATLTVVGVGNRWRGDDAAGIHVVARLRGTLEGDVRLVEHEGEPTVLIDSWQPEDSVWLVDAVSSGAPAGTIHRVEAGSEQLPAELFRASTHHFGLAETIELARAVGRLPRRVVVYGIEGERFELSEGLTPAVRDAVVRTAAAVSEEVSACTSAR